MKDPCTFNIFVLLHDTCMHNVHFFFKVVHNNQKHSSRVMHKLKLIFDYPLSYLIMMNLNVLNILFLEIAALSTDKKLAPFVWPIF